jgi:hypothetical protein
VLGGDLLGDAPVGVERIKAGRHARREARHAKPEPAGGAGADGVTALATAISG